MYEKKLYLMGICTFFTIMVFASDNVSIVEIQSKMGTRTFKKVCLGILHEDVIDLKQLTYADATKTDNLELSLNSKRPDELYCVVSGSLLSFYISLRHPRLINYFRESGKKEL